MKVYETCSLCERELRSRTTGLCGMHYLRLKRSGHPLIKRRARGEMDAPVVYYLPPPPPRQPRRKLEMPVVPCAHCGEVIRGTAADLTKRLERNSTGMLFCNNACKLAARRKPKPVWEPPVSAGKLEPAQVAILMELADGQARSVGLISDVTAYSVRTVQESIYRLRRKFGAESIEITYKPFMKFRLTEKISLA